MEYSNLKNEIKRVDNSSLADQVERNLIEFFIEKKLKVNDPIPKEIELAKALGVSRTVIREALVRLKMIGLINTKKHRGAVITNPDLFALLEKNMNPRILDSGTLKEMFEIRLVLEIGMADLIFHRITPQDILELEEIVKNEPKKSADYLFDINHEISFHGKLYDITGNNTLRRFQRMLLPIFQYVHDSGLLEKNIKIKRYVSHQQLVDILKKGTPDQFREAMRHHLENHFKRLF